MSTYEHFNMGDNAHNNFGNDLSHSVNPTFNTGLTRNAIPSNGKSESSQNDKYGPKKSGVNEIYTDEENLLSLPPLSKKEVEALQEGNPTISISPIQIKVPDNVLCCETINGEKRGSSSDLSILNESEKQNSTKSLNVFSNVRKEESVPDKTPFKYGHLINYDTYLGTGYVEDDDKISYSIKPRSIKISDDDDPPRLNQIVRFSIEEHKRQLYAVNVSGPDGGYLKKESGNTKELSPQKSKRKQHNNNSNNNNNNPTMPPPSVITTGTVITWNQSSGSGTIQEDDNDDNIIFSRLDMVCSRTPAIAPGSRVRFILIVKNNAKCARSITSHNGGSIPSNESPDKIEPQSGWGKATHRLRSQDSALKGYCPYQPTTSQPETRRYPGRAAYKGQRKV